MHKMNETIKKKLNSKIDCDPLFMLLLRYSDSVMYSLMWSVWFISQWNKGLLSLSQFLFSSVPTSWRMRALYWFSHFFCTQSKQSKETQKIKSLVRWVIGDTSTQFKRSKLLPLDSEASDRLISHRRERASRHGMPGTLLHSDVDRPCQPPRRHSSVEYQSHAVCSILARPRKSSLPWTQTLALSLCSRCWLELKRENRRELSDWIECDITSFEQRRRPVTGETHKRDDSDARLCLVAPTTDYCVFFSIEFLQTLVVSLLDFVLTWFNSIIRLIKLNGVCTKWKSQKKCEAVE